MTVEELNAVLAQAPFIAFLGISVLSYDAERQMIAASMPERPELARLDGTSQHHGGAIAAFIDTAGDCAAAMVVGRLLPTMNFRVDYLRPVSGLLQARATVRRAGLSTILVDVDVTDPSDRLAVIGRAVFASG